MDGPINMPTGWTMIALIYIQQDGVIKLVILWNLLLVSRFSFYQHTKWFLNFHFVVIFCYLLVLAEEDIKNTSICPTPGCRGIGHVKGKHPVHHMILSCPYSSMNYLRDDHIPDRFCSKREYYEVKETSASKG